MQTLFNRHTCVAFIAASAIIGLTGLMLERSLDSSYESALPKGTVEICEVQPTASGDLAISASHGNAQP